MTHWLDAELHRKYHDVAQLFPLLSGDEYEQLKNDIATNGLYEPIWLHPNGQIVDGRNRHRACVETETEPRFRTWDGSGSLVSFVVSMNLHRRHLSSSQRAVVALDVLPMLEEEMEQERRKNLSISRSKSVAQIGEFIPQSQGGRGDTDAVPIERRSTAQAAEIVQTNPRYVSDAKKLQQEAPDLLEQVRVGDLTIPKAKKKFRQRERKERAAQTPAQEPGLYRAESATIIIGDACDFDLSQFERYGVIVADPPWRYDFSVDNTDAIETQYATMSLSDIYAMPISELALDDAVLLLWGTWPKLKEAIKTLESWGFDYVTGFPWVKLDNSGNPNYGMGYWVRGCSEYILIGRRGNVSPPSLEGFLGILSPNFQHSRKPDSVHEIAEALPGPHLELFARRPRQGWTVFGNQIETESQ